ncbi:double-strand break repair protein AddB [Rhodobacterales bacterium 52_120_T64]|nr:double-strand break repair protein AddB [Rhodobacterales bacterium 52_120_T64]
MFEAQTTPRVFALPTGVDFSQEFVNGLLSRLEGQPPEALAKVVIYVNTRRSARGIEAILASNGARLLPEIRVVTDLAQDPAIPLAAPIPALRRKLIIARLVAAFIEQQPDVAPQSAVFDLTDSLGDLLDSFQGDGLVMDALADIEVGGQSEHWERSKKFLEILNEYWNNHRPENALDAEERQRAVAEGYATLWAKFPPKYPVIVAGSTGSRGATAVFMQAVAKLPQGAVVLPGFDYDTPPEAWDAMAEDHPQYGFGYLATFLDFPIDPPSWTEVSPVKHSRNKLVSLAMRPAPVTDQWLQEGPRLASDLPDACEGMTLIEASSQRAEAEAIAIRLRRAADEGQKAALVTPDRVLARRVASVLSRWDISPDDSAGRPLPLTPPGVFLRRLVALVGSHLTPEGLLAILKHPLCGGVAGRSEHLQMTRKLELEMLRGGAPFIDWAELTAWAEKADATNWIDTIHAALLPLLNAAPEMHLSDWITLHRDIAERLSGGLDELGPLWEKEAGEAALEAFAAMEEEAAFGSVIPIVQYRALFQSVLNGIEVRNEAYLPHPNIAILGTLEARVQSADLVVLGGLNEGIWPSAPQPDPWMSRDMRRQIGLPLPERRTGLSAHDFQQAIAARQVVLSRSIRDGDAPTVASRWVIRLLNLLNGLGPVGITALNDMRARGADLLALSEAMNLPECEVLPAVRPSPSPPVSARPDQLSVTRIETLIRDPFTIYAEKVLKLRALDPPGKVADARERGTALHKVLEVFVERTQEGLPEDAEKVFGDVAREVLEDLVPWPSVRRLWLARLRKIAGWFVAGERDRRERAGLLAQEASGKRALGGFTLTAKADRIDMLANGSFAIYDYKSGGLPSKRQAKEFAVQLPLEGAIAQAGGFEGIAKGKVSHLELIGLGAGGKELSLDFSDEEINEIWGQLGDLIQAFGSEKLGYTAHLRPERIQYSSDYDHLARFGEWQDGDEFEAEAME